MRPLIVAGALLVAPAALPASASAHGLVGRADLPIPDWMFSWGAAMVLIASFMALAAAWSRPKLQTPAWRPLPPALDRAISSRVVEGVCGLIGVALLLLTVIAGFAGAQNTSDNFAPSFVYIAFWLGLVPLSVLFGDVYRAFNPWRATARAVAGVSSRLSAASPEPIEYPPKLGYWPAAIGLFTFGWLELVLPSGDQPFTIALAIVAYSAVTWVGMALYGVEQWTARGEAFSVYFNLFSRLSVFERRDGVLGLRPPLAGLPHWPLAPGAVAFVVTMIGVVSFDGLSAGPMFGNVIAGPLLFLRQELGLEASTALQIVLLSAMVAMTLLIAAFYLVGVRGARVAGRHTTSELAGSYAHSLVPIALAYVAAHYVSLLLLQGQGLARLASDPLGRGANLIGTATAEINYGLLGAETFWYLQLAFVVIGHMAALTLAHDRALALVGDSDRAVRSQYSLLAVMIGFTVLALWLLAQAREG